jgi:hypothetical protein
MRGWCLFSAPVTAVLSFLASLLFSFLASLIL